MGNTGLFGLRSLRLSPAVRIGVGSGLVCFLALLVTYGWFTDRFFFGISSGPFMMSTAFGLPEATVRAGVVPIYDLPIYGWDGQFYYHQSNDPFLLGDTHKHLDNPSYRYQRNLTPLLAYCTSRAAGYSVTPPQWFQTVQFALAALGCGVLAWLLRENGLSPWMTCVWLLSGGVIWSMFRGLPDAPADALFIVTIAALQRGNLAWYAVFASLLLLCREGYAVFAAAVFGLTCLGRVPWRTNRSRLVQAAIAAIPGVVVLGWAWYIAERLNLPLLAGSKSVPFGGLVDWPFFSAFRLLAVAIKHGLKYEIIYKSITIVTLLTTLGFAAWNWRKSPIFAAAIPYIVLVAATGDIIWADANGYLKAAGSVLIIAMLLTSYDRGAVLKTVLVANLLMGVHCGYKKNYRQVDRNIPPVTLNPADLVNPRFLEPPLPAAAGEVADIRGRVRLQPVELQRVQTAGLFSFAPRPLTMFEADVENTGDETWRQTLPGKNCLCLGFELRNAEGAVVREGRRYLQRAVPAGEQAHFLVAFATPAAGEYQLRVGMLQEGGEFREFAAHTETVRLR